MLSTPTTTTARRSGAAPVSAGVQDALRKRLADTPLRRLAAELSSSPEALARALSGLPVRLGTRTVLERELGAAAAGDGTGVRVPVSDSEQPR